MARNTTRDRALDVLSGKAGCLLASLTFALCGVTFLWAFFAATRVRGNRGMLLVAGAVFTLAGLAGAAGALATRGRRR